MAKRLNNYFIIPLYILLTAMAATSAWYLYINHCIVPDTQKKLWAIMLEKEAEVNTLLKKHDNQSGQLANDENTRKILQLLVDNTAQKTDIKDYKSYLAAESEKMEFKDILLIGRDKKILFSTNKSIALGTDLTDEKYRNSPLAKSCERSTTCLTGDFAQYFFDEIFEKPALLVTVPIINNKKFIGTLAYQFKEQDMYRIAHEYTKLEKTGEIIFAQQDDTFIVYTTPSRHDTDLAFKKKVPHNKQPLSIQASVLGSQGTGTAVDYRDVPVVTAWTFITKLNWGMVVKMDTAEAREPLQKIFNILIFIAILTLIFLALIEYLYDKPLLRWLWTRQHAFPFNKIHPSVKNVPFFFLMLFALLTAATLLRYQRTHQHIMQSTKEDIIDDIDQGAQKISSILNKILFTTQSIADDLQFKRLSNDDLIKRIKRDLSENNTLTSITIAFAPYAYSPDVRLFAPSLARENTTYKEIMIDKLYDYSDPRENTLKTGWYQRAFNSDKKEVWLTSYKKTDDGAILPPTYSRVFFDKDKKPMGVISIAYKLNDIERIAEYSSLNRTGYSVLIDQNGRLLFHPITKLMLNESTLLEYARQTGDEGLAKIAKENLIQKPTLNSYHSLSTQEHMWIYMHPIAINDWVLGAIFPESDISLEPDIIKKYYFFIIMYFLMALLSACALLYTKNALSSLHTAIIITIILFSSLIALWKTIQETASITSKNSAVITDQASLDKFLDDLEEERKRKHEEPPVTIPCGLLLYSLDISRSDNMIISGYIWNKYNSLTNEGISHLVQLPHATNLTMGTPLNSTVDGEETVTWSIRGTIFQKQDYRKFPFDKQEMQITLEHHNIEKNIILTPDLEAYRKLSHQDTPGLDKSFTIAGFNIEQTFFGYKKIDPVANLGFKEYGKTTDYYQLVYSIITARNLINPFLIFFLPLLGILLSIFCVLLISRTDSTPFSILSPYTATFFTLIILQRVLRDQYTANTPLYMEYAFFFTYITITILSLHAVVTYLCKDWKYYQKTVFPLMKLLFWPFQFILWIITTLIVFY